MQIGFEENRRGDILPGKWPFRTQQGQSPVQRDTGGVLQFTSTEVFLI
jgi:hypothetical protein